MSFVDQAAALERQRRMQDMLDRISNLNDDELKRLDRVLGVQVLINDTVNTEFPITTVSSQTSQSNIKGLLSSRIETVRSNLTQIMGYTPTDEDVQELLKIRRVYGAGFTGAMRQISATINDVQGGIGEVLKAIDTGITSTIDTATRAAQQAIDEVNNLANAAISSITSTVNTAISSATSSVNTAVSSVISANTINSLRSTTRDLTALLNNPLSLIPTLTNYFSASMDDRIRRIDEELNLISRELQEVSRQRADSTVSTQNATTIQNTIQEGINTPPTNPDPVSVDGTPYLTYPNNAYVRPDAVVLPSTASAWPIREDETRIKSNQYVSNVYFPTGTGGRYIPIIERVVSRRISSGDYIIRLAYFNFEGPGGSASPILNSVTSVVVKLGNTSAVRAFYTNLSNVPRDTLTTVRPAAGDTIAAPPSVEEIVNNFAIPTNATLRS